jgi:hypothetical protein
MDDKPKPKLTEEKPLEIAASIVSAAAASEVTEKQERKDKDGDADGEGWKLLKCPTCRKSFYNNFTLSVHQCNPS